MSHLVIKGLNKNRRQRRSAMAKISIKLTVEEGILSQDAQKKLKDALEMFVGDHVLDIITQDLIETKIEMKQG